MARPSERENTSMRHPPTRAHAGESLWHGRAPPSSAAGVRSDQVGRVDGGVLDAGEVVRPPVRHPCSQATDAPAGRNPFVRRFKLTRAGAGARIACRSLSTG